MQAYTYKGPVKCDAEFDKSHVKGKIAIVTGGANGIGEAYVRNLTAAGAFVVFGDIDEKCGQQVAADVPSGAAQFVKCDVTQWKDQLAMFKHALEKSPSQRIDIVVANAGITAADSIFSTSDEEDPAEPELNVLNINGIGALYTVKLALHYFRRQTAANKGSAKDQLLVLQGSLAGYLDLPGAVQYGFTKFGLRSVMRNLRQTEYNHGIRVNYIGPWFIKTKILGPVVIEKLTEAGYEFAEVEDAAKTLMKIASDSSINGHSFAVLPRSQAEFGYVDLDVDDYKEGGLLKKLNDLASGAQHRADAEANGYNKPGPEIQ